MTLLAERKEKTTPFGVILMRSQSIIPGCPGAKRYQGFVLARPIASDDASKKSELCMTHQHGLAVTSLLHL